MTRTSNANYVIFHDCFSSSILQKISVAEQKAAKRRSGKGRKKDIKPAVDKSPANDNDNGEELEDFVEVSWPLSLRHSFLISHSI